MFRMSEAAAIAELLAARFARASRPTKVVLQMLFSEDYKGGCRLCKSQRRPMGTWNVH